MMWFFCVQCGARPVSRLLLEAIHAGPHISIGGDSSCMTMLERLAVGWGVLVRSWLSWPWGWNMTALLWRLIQGSTTSRSNKTSRM